MNDKKNCTSNSVKSLSSFIRWAVSASRRSVAKIAVECSSAKSAVNSLTCWEKQTTKTSSAFIFTAASQQPTLSFFRPHFPGENATRFTKKRKQKRNEQQLGITLGSSGKGQGARSQEPGRGWLGKSQVEQLLQLQHFFWLVTKLHTRARAIISAVGVSSFTFFLSRGWAGGSGRFLLDFLLLSSIFFSTFQFHFPGAYF
jgi:hypothetical protein